MASLGTDPPSVQTKETQQDGKSRLSSDYILEHQEEKSVDRLALLIEIGRTLSGARDLDQCLTMIVDLTSDVLEAERATIFLYDPKTDELISKVAEGLDESREIRFPATTGLAGHVCKTGELLNIPDAWDDPRFNKEFDEKSGFRTRSVMGAPLIGRHNHIIGVLQVLNRRGGEPFQADDLHLLEGVAGQCAVALANASLLSEIDTLFEAFVEMSSRAIDQRDPTTAGHSRRVTLYTLNLARSVHYCEDPPFKDKAYTRESLRQLRYAGLLHDFGKIGVREAVLSKEMKFHPGILDKVLERIKRTCAEEKIKFLLDRIKQGSTDLGEIAAKLGEFQRDCDEVVQFVTERNFPGFVDDEQMEKLRGFGDDGTLTEDECRFLCVRRGNLTEDEFDDIKSHVSKSYQVLKVIPWPEDLGEVPRIAHGHHEKLDGSGYPLGLSKGEIHFDSEIMTVADIYDALTASDRPYKKAMTHERAMEILREEAAAGKLNKDLVELFENKRCYVIDEKESAQSSVFEDGLDRRSKAREAGG